MYCYLFITTSRYYYVSRLEPIDFDFMSVKCFFFAREDISRAFIVIHSDWDNNIIVGIIIYCSIICEFI